MGFAYFEMSVVATIPAIILAIFVYINDRKEKEPLTLLALLFAVGGVAYVPVYFLEKSVCGLIDKAFSQYAIGSVGGIVGYTEQWAEYAHGMLIVLVGVALIEELIKWLVTFLITFRNKNFNCLYDGIVYSTFVALGFAMAENLIYAWQGGWDLLLKKTLTTLPAHLLFAVIMGYFYAMWKARKTAATVEKHYAKKGIITIRKPVCTWNWFLAMVGIPVLHHAVYGFAGYFGTDLFNVIFYVLNAVMFTACIILVVRLSKKDATGGRYADMLLDKKYPEIKDLYDDVAEIAEEVQSDE